MRFVRTCKQFARRVLQSSPLLAPLRSFYRGIGTVLLYHRVVSDDTPSDALHPYSGLTVQERVFSDHMAHLKERYECLSLPQFVDRLKNGTLHRDCVAITFDDGYRDNYTRALPILERHGVPATVFVTTGLVDRVCRAWWYEQEAIISNLRTLNVSWGDIRIARILEKVEERYGAMRDIDILLKRLPPSGQQAVLQMLRGGEDSSYSYDQDVLNWDEVIALDKHPLITIGAHTVNHYVLSTLTTELLRNELVLSKALLEERLGHPVEHFAYPYGGAFEAGEREFFAAKEAGYTSAWTTRFGHVQRDDSDALFSLPRIPIDHYDTDCRFEAKLSGIDSMLINKGRRGR